MLFEDARGHDCKDIPLATKVQPLAGSKDFCACFHTLHPTLCICVCVCVYECVDFFLSASLCASPLRTRDTTQTDVEFERSSLLLKQEEEEKNLVWGNASETEFPFLHLHFLSLGVTKSLSEENLLLRSRLLTVFHDFSALSATPALGFGRTELLSRTAALGFGRMERLHARRVRGMDAHVCDRMKFEHYSFIHTSTHKSFSSLISLPHSL